MTSSTILTDSTDRFGYDTIAETYHAQYDWTSDSPLSITVVGVVAAVIGEEPTEMEPLHSVIVRMLLIRSYLRGRRRVSRSSSSTRSSR